ncbi:HMG-box [Neoconidiobolus thromboides FSU 785]|nr:HMG-box [Neoconidiobolus thromboides FSU 785]
MNNTTSTSQFFRPPNFPQNNYDATWINSSVSEEKGAFDSKYYQNSASSDSHNKKQGGSSPLMGNETEISKRKYRRHPKTDPNAPAKPQTAYIKFSSSVRESGKFKQLSFTESAKVVAKLWKDLDQSTKNYFLQEAHKDRIRYREEMAVYRTSSSYREYRAYLTEFYGQGGQIVRSVGRPAKLSTPELHKNMFQ